MWAMGILSIFWKRLCLSFAQKTVSISEKIISKKEEEEEEGYCRTGREHQHDITLCRTLWGRQQPPPLAPGHQYESGWSSWRSPASPRTWTEWRSSSYLPDREGEGERWTSGEAVWLWTDGELRDKRRHSLSRPTSWKVRMAGRRVVRVPWRVTCRTPCGVSTLCSWTPDKQVLLDVCINFFIPFIHFYLP